MYYYLKYFYIFSILGHFIEGFFYTSGESGILYGYWTPVYGLGVCTILVLYNQEIKASCKGFQPEEILELWLDAKVEEIKKELK